MSRQTELFYNWFAPMYPAVDLFLRPQKRAFFDEIGQLPAGNLLEVGVGNGSHLHLYKNHRVTAIDTSSSMLAAALRRNLPDIELVKMDGEKLLFPDGIFDYVVMSHVLAVADNPSSLLQEVTRVLKPGGKILILNHFTPDNSLKYFDRAFSIFSAPLRFRSVFRIEDISIPRELSLIREKPAGYCSYFKMLIYQKK